jgi:Eukaryotic aspartyl protease
MSAPPMKIRTLASRAVSSHLALLAVIPLVIPLAACGATASSPVEPNDGGSGDTAPPLIIIIPPADLDGGHGGSGSGSTTSGTGSGGGTEGDAGMDSGMEVKPDAVTAIALVGCTPSEYTLGASIGSDTGVFHLALDTGSSSLGVASSTCTSCGVSPEYSPDTTGVQMGSSSEQFGSGEISGPVYQDNVNVAAGLTTSVDFIAITSSEQFFGGVICGTSGMQGIVGFGPTGSAVQGTNDFFTDLVGSTGIDNVFATQLCDGSGTLWLGGYDPTYTTGAVQYADIDTGFIGQYYYAVNLESVTVNGVTVPIATGEYTDTIVDTGTSIFILPTASLNGIANAIAATPGYQQVFGITPSGDAGTDAGPAGGGTASLDPNAQFFANAQSCVTLSQTKAELDALLPPLTLNFGGTTSIAVQAAPTESYLIPEFGEWCPTMIAMDPSDQDPLAAILGSPMLRSNIIVFDRTNERIGFAPHTPCPQ